jgi:hypothetical protein
MRRINRQQFARLSYGAAALVKQLLQDELNVNIVAYSRARHDQSEGQEGTISLCQVVVAGRLSGAQLGSLRMLEAKLGKDVALVAYAKPWRRNDSYRRQRQPVAI